MGVARSRQLKSGMTILDAVLALAMFGIFFGFIVQLLFGGQESLQVSSRRQQAARILQEAVAAVGSVMNGDFENVVAGEYGLATSSGAYTLATGTQEIDIFSRVVAISEIDYWTKLVSVSVEWMQNLQRNGALSFVWRVYDWSLGIIDHQGVLDLGNVYKNSVEVATTTTSTLAVARAGDWSKPIWYKDYDVATMSGAADVAMHRQYLYLVSKLSNGYPELVRFDVNNLSGGGLAVDQTWIVGRPLIAAHFQESSQMAYFASTDPYEITALNLDNNLFSVINVQGNVAPTDIWVSGDKIFLVKNNDAVGPELEIYNTNGVRVGSREIGAAVNKVMVDGSYVYLATALDNGELMVVNHDNCALAPPYTCALVRQYDMAGAFDATALERGEGDTWYVGRANGSVYGLNIPNPLNINQTWTRADITTLIKDLEFDATENILSVASNRGNTMELSFYNLNTLALSAVDLPGSGAGNLVNGVIKYGAFVYAASNNVGPELQIVRPLVGSWEQPVATGVFNPPTTSNANRSFVSGDRAYMGLDQTAGGPEFYVLNVSNPAAPTFLGAFETNADVNDVWVNDGYAYLATGIDSQEVMVFDVTQNIPQLLVSLDLPGSADALTLTGDVARGRLMVGTASNTSGYDYDLYVIDISGAKTLAALRYLAGYDVGGAVNDLDFDTEKQRLYLSTGNTASELQVLDVSSANDVIRLDDYNSTGGTANGVDYDVASQRVVMTLANNGASDDFYVFATDGLKAAVADWSQLQSVVVNGEPVSAGTVMFVDDDNYAYLGTLYPFSNDPSLYIYDVAAPSYPRLVGSYVAGGTVWDVKVDDNYAYLATSNSGKEFQVVNVADKTSPAQASFYNMAGSDNATGLDVLATTTYVGMSSNMLYALDTSNPSSVGLRGSLNVNKSLREVSAGPDYVALATDPTNGGMSVVNVRNWNNMSVAATFNANNRCADVFYDKPRDRVFLGCDLKSTYQNLWLIDMQNPTSMFTLASEIINYPIIDMQVRNQRVYLTSSSSQRPVMIYDLVNNNDFVYLSYFDVSGDADALAIKDDHIYLAGHGSSSEFQVIGPTWLSSSSMSLYKSLNLNSDNYSAVIKGQQVLVASASSTEGIKIVNIANASNAKVINTMSTGLSYDLATADNGDVYVCSADDLRELQILRAGPQSSKVAGFGWFTSQPYNSGSASTRWRSVMWNKLGDNGSTVLHIRTAPDNGGVPGAWSKWLGQNDENGYTEVGVTHQINNTQSDRSNDQWLQYRMLLKPSAPDQSPYVSGLRFFYD